MQRVTDKRIQVFVVGFFSSFIYLILYFLNYVTLWHHRGSAQKMVMIQLHTSHNYFSWFYACVFPAKIHTSKQQNYAHVYGDRFEFSFVINLSLYFNSVYMIIFAFKEKNPTNMSISIFRFRCHVILM